VSQGGGGGLETGSEKLKQKSERKEEASEKPFWRTYTRDPPLEKPQGGVECSRGIQLRSGGVGGGPGRSKQEG